MTYTSFPAHPIARPRRLREKASLRALVRETALSLDSMIYPMFIRHGHNDVRAIAAMAGQNQWTLDFLGDELKRIQELGIKSVMFFGIPEHKDAVGSDNTSITGIIPSAIRLAREVAPKLTIISDLCLCDYADHGHCGLVDEAKGLIHNDETLEYLHRAAVVHARAGSDMIAPSGMMDGMIKAIRQGLDENGFQHIPTMSYAAKYASAFYGPFRQAAESAARFGDRTGYQMDPANALEAIKEVAIDLNEGADIVMVKPALLYLDVIRMIKQEFPVPLAAYQVSGEYAMIVAAAERGWIDLKSAAMESLLAIRRAGADIILSYWAKDVARWMRGE